MSKRRKLARIRRRIRRYKKRMTQRKTSFFAKLFRRISAFVFVVLCIGLIQTGAVVWVWRLLIWAFTSAAGEIVLEVTHQA